MKITKERIEEIKVNGYPLDFGVVFEHAFENYKKIAVYAGLILFVSTILFVILGAIGLISMVDIENFSKEMNPEDFEIKNFSTNILLIYISSIVLLAGLSSPFTAGFLKMADCGEKGLEFKVSTLFSYYKSPFFKELFVATFLISLITVTSSTLLEYFGQKFIGLLISLLITFLTYMTIPLISFGKLTAIDALKSSITIVSKQPLIILALLIVGFIASMIGIIGCCVGLFFTMPFMYSTHYCLYNAIVGIEPESETKEITS